MDDHLVRLEATVEQLRSAVQSLEKRMALLEARRPVIAAAAAEGAAGQAAPAGLAMRLHELGTRYGELEILLHQSLDLWAELAR